MGPAGAVHKRMRTRARVCGTASGTYRARMRPALLVSLLLMVLGACTASPASGRALESHTLVYLRTGPRTGLTKEQQQAVFAGHMANMQRLAREGKLLLAGPYGRSRSDPALRGIFVMATADAGEARSWAETDPGFAEGVFALDYAGIETDYPLRAMVDADLAAEDARARSGHKAQPGEFGRGYVMLTAADGAAAEAAWRQHPQVLFFARLAEGKAISIVDAEDAAGMARIDGLDTAGVGALQVDEWFATRTLVDHAPNRVPRRG